MHYSLWYFIVWNPGFSGHFFNINFNFLVSKASIKWVLKWLEGSRPGHIIYFRYFNNFNSMFSTISYVTLNFAVMCGETQPNK